ncbi:hypothetical protein PsorP6_004434 [Peronosclerospora sorghi]|uniref:Uncharacterized protein n=1 Tax=Peronosclerospora sorghi TaxID=230839 RepID=A0ACC0VKB2_9STRA|nr:hypothetical protein PsorP6_004434 [Peronosclerospora sorghi]
MLSKNVAVETAAQSAMLLPSGHLLLLVDTLTYQQLGIVGEKYGKAIPPSCRTGQTTKYVISLDLTSKMFTQEGDNAVRDRIRSRFRSKFEKFEMLLCAYNGRGSPRTILFEEDDAVLRSRVELNSTMTTLQKIFLPRFHAFYEEWNAQEDNRMDVLRTSLQEAYDWLGLVACRLTDLLQRQKTEEYVSTFTGTPTSFECEPDSEITTLRWRGLLAAPFCSNLVEKVLGAVKNHELPWAAITVWGFPDTFVSWIQQPKGQSKFQRREHGYLGNGSNNYTILMLPNDEYFILQELGPQDATV